MVNAVTFAKYLSVAGLQLTIQGLFVVVVVVHTGIEYQHLLVELSQITRWTTSGNQYNLIYGCWLLKKQNSKKKKKKALGLSIMMFGIQKRKMSTEVSPS